MFCNKHREICFTCDLGECKNCLGQTTSGAMKYCDNCSKQLSVCALCCEPVDQEEWQQWLKGREFTPSVDCTRPKESKEEVHSPMERLMWWIGVSLIVYIGYKMYF